MMDKHKAKIDDYLAKAVHESGLAQDTGLTQVRERHEAAALAWTELARSEETMMLALRARLDALGRLRPLELPTEAG